MNELVILDVGHGNSALLISQGESAIFDASPGNTLLETLERYELKKIDYVYLSHWDEDHVGGLVALLSTNEIEVGNLIANPDSTKRGPHNRRLRILIADAEQRYGLDTSRKATASIRPLEIGEVSVKVLAPSSVEYYGGAGGQDTAGRRLDSNSASVVLQIVHQSQPIALFAADIDQRSLNSMIERNQALASDILVFPHHGGNCADSEQGNISFTQQLASLVRPKVTIFSMGRSSGYDNPRPEIVAAVRKAVPNTYISCTQLSPNCLVNLPNERLGWLDHLENLPADGFETETSCGGTLRFRLEGSSTQYLAKSELHTKFIQINIPDALCQRVDEQSLPS